MKYGLSESSLKLLISEIVRYEAVERAEIFGSRAIGNYKHGSDVDIALYGKQLSDQTVNELSVRFNEQLPLPYYFDLVNYETLHNVELKKHIDQYGNLIYKRDCLETR